ncbi:MAG: hypothetical protein CME69_10525 [Halobacteriovorax sp.]|nr:hypothetical protein [Halobacteriovorax sp.]
MNLKEKNSSLYLVSTAGAFLIVLLGSWWLYLLFTLSSKLQENHVKDIGPNIVTLIKWEGSFFLFVLVIFFVSHTLLFLKDQKKNKSLHNFFAGLTHELKTPLASIRLQSEVLSLEVEKTENDKIKTLTKRLIEDTVRLEDQLNKTLQLSRVERDGELNISSINMLKKFQSLSNVYDEVRVTIDATGEDFDARADEFALEVIFKNLLENTKIHGTDKEALVSIKNNSGFTTLTYTDDGHFSGDLSKLGELFYKHNSKRGSGIGLYLCKKLTHKMKGKFLIEQQGESLKFTIKLPSGEDIS